MSGHYRFRRSFGNVGSLFRGARPDTYPLATVLTDTEFDDLTLYEDKTYIVTDWATYEGSVIQSYEPFNPAVDDIHIKTTGSDLTGDGTEGNPFANIARALRKNVLDGTTHRIWLHDGTYAQDEFINGTTGSTNTGQGRLRIIGLAPASEIVISAVPGDTVTLTSTSANGLIDSEGTCANVTFRGFVLQPAASAPEVDISSGTFDNFKITDCVSTTGTGARSVYVKSASVDIRVLRCTFTNASAARNVDARLADGFRLIGCTVIGDSTTICFRPYNGLVGNWYCNNNTLTGGQGIIQNAAFDSSGNSLTIKNNTIVTSLIGVNILGGSALNPLTVTIDNNNIEAGRQGCRVVNYSTITSVSHNYVRAGLNNTGGSDTGLGFPGDGPLSGFVTVGKVEYNDANSENGHAAIVGEVASGATVRYNTFGGASAYDYGFVVKGTGHTISHNTITAGSAGGLYLKGVESSTVSYNTISGNSTTGVLRTDAGGGGTDTITLRYNTVSSNDSPLLGIGTSDIGNNFDSDFNTYVLTGTATWGSVLENTVTSLDTLKSAWSGYAIPTNDSNSTEGTV